MNKDEGSRTLHGERGNGPGTEIDESDDRRLAADGLEPAFAPESGALLAPILPFPTPPSGPEPSGPQPGTFPSWGA
jgi:hypothetical protein